MFQEHLTAPLYCIGKQARRNCIIRKEHFRRLIYLVNEINNAETVSRRVSCQS